MLRPERAGPDGRGAQRAAAGGGVRLGHPVPPERGDPALHLRQRSVHPVLRGARQLPGRVTNTGNALDFAYG